jgi:TIR domain/LGFP repeat
MPVKIFFCYAHEDEPLLNKLKTHLRPLQRQGLIDIWHDRDISAGTEWEREISQRLNSAQIILLLLSPDFMDSDYCYGVEMKRAIERHKQGEARVIPVILRHVYWQGEPLGRLQALPTDGVPIIDASWHSLDRAFFNVTEGIRKVIEGILEHLSSSVVESHESVEEFLALEDYPEHVAQAIRECYFQLGDAAINPLGVPAPINSNRANPQTSIRGTIGYTCSFTKGTIYWSENSGPQPIYGSIGECYKSIGAIRSPLGFPSSSVVKAASSSYGTTGFYQDFEAGAIFWCEKYGSIQVVGPISSIYDKSHGTWGRYGFPKSPEVFDADHPGVRLQEFEGGVIRIGQ